MASRIPHIGRAIPLSGSMKNKPKWLLELKENIKKIPMSKWGSDPAMERLLGTIDQQSYNEFYKRYGGDSF